MPLLATAACVLHCPQIMISHNIIITLYYTMTISVHLILCRFEDLRIRRETKSKNYSKEGGRKADKTKGGRNDKTACLLFTATLQLSQDKEIELSILSKPIQLCKHDYTGTCICTTQCGLCTDIALLILFYATSKY